VALISVAEALARILAQAEPLDAEPAALEGAHCRVLAADLPALRTQPPDDLSAMDGYAVRAADLAAPARLKVIGEVPAGHPFPGQVGPGEAVRIFTGGLLPRGADAVVAQEDTRREGDAVDVTIAIGPGKHIRRAGIDFLAGDVLLRRGHRLSGRDLTLAAALNHASVPVIRRPRLALLATGDELVFPGRPLERGQIVYSNGYAVMALAQSEGAEVTNLGIVRDDLSETVAAIRRARATQTDILVTTGGASVGDYDFVQQALAAEGLALSFWKVALRPGRPLMHGRLGAMHVLGLPGNPASAYVCAVLFLLPLIRKLAGRGDLVLPVEPALLGADVPENDLRADYLRATLSWDAAGRLVATALPSQDSSLMSVLARADALLLREPHAAAARAGEPCRIVKLPL
jgi:molybdopterin molybdotransferase